MRVRGAGANDTLRAVIPRLATGVFCVLLFSGSAAAQTVNNGRAWFLLTVQGYGGKASRWRWSVDGIVRSRDGVRTLDNTSVRPLLLYKATTHSSVGGGYVFVSSYPATGGTTTEHRLIGFYTWAGAAAGGNLSFRFVMEDRMIAGNSGLLWRARQQARFTHPVRPNSRLAWVGYDELLVHLNTTTRAPRGVDQNRAFAGLSIAWSPRLRTETGYVNRFVPGHGSANRLDHIVSGWLTITF